MNDFLVCRLVRPLGKSILSYKFIPARVNNIWSIRTILKNQLSQIYFEFVGIVNPLVLIE